MDVGMDCVSPVCADYEDKGVFPFTGEIKSVTFMFGPSDKATGMERLKLATRMD
jgi:arylsulfatase